jgi:hypothetical protein
MSERLGLLIAAHGSRNRSWNARVAELARTLAKRPNVYEHFEDRVSEGFLEAAEPSLVQAYRALERAGATRVVVVPLFLTASSHLDEDLPVVLGLRDEPTTRANLAAEGIDTLPLGAPVALLTPLARSGALAQNALRRALSMARDPASEGVVFTYYGSPRHAAQWGAMLESVGLQLVSNGGFAAWDAAPVGQWVPGGHTDVSRALSRGLEQWERAVLVPLLMSVSHYQTEVMPAAIDSLPALDRARVSYRGCSILPCEKIEDWAEALAISATPIS